MALLEKATNFILNILAEDETIKSFPKEFIASSTQWIQSWFLKDDPKIATKLKDPERSTDNKKGLIENKLEDKLDDPSFKAALEEQLATFEQQKSRAKNVLDQANVEVQGSVHIGDTGSSADEGYDEKNIIKGSTIKAGGDFRLGDEVITGNKQVNITHNHYTASTQSGDATAAPVPSLPAELKILLAKEKTTEVIDRLLDLSEGKDKDLNQTVLLLSARYTRIKSQEDKGVITVADAGIERNKINVSLVNLIDEELS